MCMFLGYAQNYTGGTYHILNLHKKVIVLIRDVIMDKQKLQRVHINKIKLQGKYLYAKR